MVQKIEISFGRDVEIPDDEFQRLMRLVDKICKKNCPEGWAFWPAGYGFKPRWSKQDAAFLGVEADPNAPDSGEPSYDESVFSIECASRELSPEEIERRKAQPKKEQHMNNEKSLGQVAYEAYCEQSNWKSLASGADLPPFADTKPEIQQAWEAAAQAVLNHNTCDAQKAAA